MPKSVFRLGLVASSLMWASVPSAQQPAVRDGISADSANAYQSLRLYFSPIRVDSGYRLTSNGYSGATHVEQTVNFGERDSARIVPVVGAAVRAIDTWNGVQFVSPPLAGPFELSGLFSGHLDFITNKQNFAFHVSLYELLSNGDYILISTYSTQSGPSGDSAHRTLLQQGVRQHLDYQSDRLPSRVIQNRSRLLALITLLEPLSVRSGYGTAGNATSATIGDAQQAELLSIKWYGESYVELHVRPKPKDQVH